MPHWGQHRAAGVCTRLCPCTQPNPRHQSRQKANWPSVTCLAKSHLRLMYRARWGKSHLRHWWAPHCLHLSIGFAVCPRPVLLQFLKDWGQCCWDCRHWANNGWCRAHAIGLVCLPQTTPHQNGFYQWLQRCFWPIAMTLHALPICRQTPHPLATWTFLFSQIDWKRLYYTGLRPILLLLGFLT